MDDKKILVVTDKDNEILRAYRRLKPDSRKYYLFFIHDAEHKSREYYPDEEKYFPGFHLADVDLFEPTAGIVDQVAAAIMAYMPVSEFFREVKYYSNARDFGREWLLQLL